jgi:uroporphyrinogen III methyltransferase/synthase
MDRMRKSGKVYIVGAGPGDEGLITIRGIQALQEADVVVYDYLANPELLRQCTEECEKIYVGKMAGEHALSQEEINRLLVVKAQEGKVVTRLKGGDPFIFGRGGEEALGLADHGLEFEIVPGISAAVAAAAYAGIPLTHRGYTSSVAFITGHEDPAKLESDVNWKMIATGAGTLAFYMGVKNLIKITDRLIENGRPPTTPAALIRWGTLPLQETLTGDLRTIAVKAEQTGFRPPAILVVGEVVGLRESLRWYDKRPLFGKKILVTRSRTQASELSSCLKALGAHVVEFPTIAITPLSDFSVLEKAIEGIEEFSWAVFTSVNGVDIFFERLFLSGRDARELKGIRVAVIGDQTALRLKNYGVRADLLPERFTSEGVLEAFQSLSEDLRGTRILFPGSEIAREYLPDGLAKMGAEVVCVPVYRNTVPDYKRGEIDAFLLQPPELVTFTSSSTVSHFVEILKKHGREGFLRGIRGVSIGPVTTSTARENSIEIVAEASPHTIGALVDAITDYFTFKERQ